MAGDWDPRNDLELVLEWKDRMDKVVVVIVVIVMTIVVVEVRKNGID